MKKIGLKTPPSGTAESMEQAMEIADQIGSYPLIIRPAFTLGGSGGGIAYNVEEFQEIVESGLQASVTTQACFMMPSLESCIWLWHAGQGVHAHVAHVTGWLASMITTDAPTEVTLQAARFCISWC